jgi:cytochrome c oxidase subunit 1
MDRVDGSGSGGGRGDEVTTLARSDSARSPFDNHHHHVDRRGFISKYIFSTDHKVIALQFYFSSLIWLFLGGLLAMLIRVQLAWPWERIPYIGEKLFASTGGQMPPEFYTMLFTMHGTVMIFLVIIPWLLGAFGNFLIPLQIGAPDMAFPRLNMLSYWMMWPAFFFFAASFVVEGINNGPAAGWTSYPPLSAVASAAPGSGTAQTYWILGVTFVGVSSMMGSINYMTTVINCRAPGMTFFRMPLSVWSLFITAILQAFALPVLTAAGLMLLADRVIGSSFFVPADLWINGVQTKGVGGTPLLWQHLFWFYSHPAVYIMILPAMGIVSEVLSTHSRKPVFGYHPMVYSMIAICGLGFIVWGHHMYTSGMNPVLGTAFVVSTVLISVPSAIKTFNWLGTMVGGRISLTTPMLHAVGFVSLFIIGGLGGIFLAVTPIDVQVHDTYFIVGHFHYVLAGGSLFGIFAGVTHWYPKMFGRMMNEFWGKVHFALTFLFMNGTFLAMHQLGAAGMPRRIADPTQYEFLLHLMPLNRFISFMAFGMGIAQLIFLVNLLGSLVFGRKAPRNPWNANSLEWLATSPAPHGNFERVPLVYRGPHEFSSPESPVDYLPQWIPPSEIASLAEADERGGVL